MDFDIWEHFQEWVTPRLRKVLVGQQIKLLIDEKLFKDMKVWRETVIMEGIHWCCWKFFRRLQLDLRPAGWQHAISIRNREVQHVTKDSFLHSYLHFSSNLGAIIDEYGELFHEDKFRRWNSCIKATGIHQCAILLRPFFATIECRTKHAMP